MYFLFLISITILFASEMGKFVWFLDNFSYFPLYKRLIAPPKLIPLHFQPPLEIQITPSSYNLRDLNLMGYKRIIAIGDLHGDYEQTRTLLKLSKIINDENKWIAQDTILIQLGDILDRGHESVETLELFLQLYEQIHHNQTLFKRNMVINLLGNHEYMNLNGDFSYLHKSELSKYGVFNWTRLLSNEYRYGSFLRNNPIIVILNDNLFVHAGLTPDILNYFQNNITKINQIVKNHLNKNLMEEDDDNNDESSIFDDVRIIAEDNKHSPIWTRLFDSEFYPPHTMLSIADFDEFICKKVEQTLKLLNVSRMFIGHNVQLNGNIKVACNNKLYSIDIGVSSYINGRLGAIEINLIHDTLSIIS